MNKEQSESWSKLTLDVLKHGLITGALSLEDYYAVLDRKGITHVK